MLTLMEVETKERIYLNPHQTSNARPKTRSALSRRSASSTDNHRRNGIHRPRKSLKQLSLLIQSITVSFRLHFYQFVHDTSTMFLLV